MVVGFCNILDFVYHFLHLKECSRNKPSLFSDESSVVDRFIKQHAPVECTEEVNILGWHHVFTWKALVFTFSSNIINIF
jgi:hypothetical protein